MNDDGTFSERDAAQLASTVLALKAGGLIAYPTEAVYGLGCDPFNERAVMSLLALKERPVSKGLILIASHWTQLSSLVGELDDERLAYITSTWPGPNTWLFPAKHVPPWVRGEHDTIALRVPAHPLARQLCRQYGGPLISTSANKSGQAAAKSAVQVVDYFGAQLDAIVDAPIGNYAEPSIIRCAKTGTRLR